MSEAGSLGPFWVASRYFVVKVLSLGLCSEVVDINSGLSQRIVFMFRVTGCVPAIFSVFGAASRWLVSPGLRPVGRVVRVASRRSVLSRYVTA